MWYLPLFDPRGFEDSESTERVSEDHFPIEGHLQEGAVYPYKPEFTKLSCQMKQVWLERNSLVSDVRIGKWEKSSVAG